MNIKFDEKNYRLHDEKNKAVIKKSVDELGAGRSILIDKDGKIIAGNGVFEQWGARPVKVIETDGSELVVVKRKDLSSNDPKRQQLAFADNHSSDLSEWNKELLLADWDELKLDGWDIELNIPNEDYKDVEEDDYEIPEEIVTDIKLGDLFTFEKDGVEYHRLICGDSTKRETFEVLMGGQQGDMVVTDPPYNVDYTGGTKDALKIQNDKMSDEEFYKFLFDFYTSMGEFIKSGGAWYVWHADSEGANFRQAMKDAGIMVKQCLIWVKNSLVMGRQDYQWQHEPCLYGWKDGAAHKWYGDRKQTTVLEFDRPTRNAEHPTMKPVPLIAYQINNSSKQGDIVVDGFAGSGTTMIAADQLNRKAYVVEYDPKYCQVIVDRVTKYKPDMVIKKNGVKLNLQ